MTDEEKIPQDQEQKKAGPVEKRRKKGPPLIGLLLLLILFVLALFTLSAIFIKKEKEENKRMALETEVGKVRKELEDARSENISLEEKLKKVKDEKDGLKIANARIVDEKKALEEELKSKDEELAQLKKTLAQKEDTNTSLEEKISQLNSSILEMMDKISALKKAVAVGSENESAASGIALKAEQAQKSARPIEGFIWTVNDVHNFTVISVGKKDGVKEGMFFDVFDQKSDTKIGKLEVKTLRDTMAVADIVAKTQKIKKGDKIRLSPSAD